MKDYEIMQEIERLSEITFDLEDMENEFSIYDDDFNFEGEF